MNLESLPLAAPAPDEETRLVPAIRYGVDVELLGDGVRNDVAKAVVVITELASDDDQSELQQIKESMEEMGVKILQVREEQLVSVETANRLSEYLCSLQPPKTTTPPPATTTTIGTHSLL